MSRSLQRKKVLITAGPTWVPIDDIRVISNISSGTNGLLLAKEALRKKARVSLILGPVNPGKIPKGIRLLRFRYFDELRKILLSELKNGVFDIIIHLAAVSDFKAENPLKGKIPSAGGLRYIRLKPTEKLSALIRKHAPDSFLVIFKLEARVSKAKLLSKAKEAMAACRADLTVANTFNGKRYRAFILSNDRGKPKTVLTAIDRTTLPRQLFADIAPRLCRMNS